MFNRNLYLPIFIKLRGRSMAFWIIMIVFITLGGTCSLAGTWWDRKKKRNNKIYFSVD